MHLIFYFHVVAQTIAKVPFTPGHEMVGEVSRYLGLVQFVHSQLTVLCIAVFVGRFCLCN